MIYLAVTANFSLCNQNIEKDAEKRGVETICRMASVSSERDLFYEVR